MIQKKLRSTALVALLGIGIVASLHAYQSLKPRKLTGFTRDMRSGNLSMISSLSLPEYSYYIIGSVHQNIYLANYQLTDHLYVIDSGFRQSHLQFLQLPVRVNWPTLEYKMTGDRLFLIDRSSRLILSAKIQKVMSMAIHSTNTAFSAFWPLSQNTSVLKFYDTTQGQNALMIMQEKNEFSPSTLLKKQNEGYFSVDGMLQKADDGRLVYIYFYRNQFLLVDTNLNLIKECHTIDTFSHTPNVIAKIKSGHSLTFYNPAVFINRKSFIYKNLLMVQSAVQADNQHTRTFNRNACIDVYVLQDGRYEYSFYIPLGDHKSITNMVCLDDYLYIIYQDKWMIKYKLNGFD